MKEHCKTLFSIRDMPDTLDTTDALRYISHLFNKLYMQLESLNFYNKSNFS